MNSEPLASSLGQGSTPRTIMASRDPGSFSTVSLVVVKAGLPPTLNWMSDIAGLLCVRAGPGCMQVNGARSRARGLWQQGGRCSHHNSCNCRALGAPIAPVARKGGSACAAKATGYSANDTTPTSARPPAEAAASLSPRRFLARPKTSS
jgi:hypothetical protein